MSTSDSDYRLNAEQMRSALERIAQHLKNPVSLCIIGSGPGILGGQPDRLSIDIDVWNKASNFAYADLRQACEKAGLLFDPKDEIQPDKPYIQIVDAGIVQVGKFSEKTPVLKEGLLVVERPPMENIVASKLLRMNETDLTDVGFLVARYGIKKSQVEKVIASFPAEQRETARENLVYLDMIKVPDPALAKVREPKERER